MPMPAIPSADLIELFSSIQGEGMLVGYRQVFLRFAGCNLDCHYCDTDFRRPDQCHLETVPGSGTMETTRNPVTLELVLERLMQWCSELPGAHHSLSLTGGEPLLHAETLDSWLVPLRRFMPIYLETNGTLPEALARLVDRLDWVAMDIKTASLTGVTTPWEEHRRFLQLASCANCFVKLVVGPQTLEEEVRQAAELVQNCDPEIPLILQPLTVSPGKGLDSLRLMQLQALAAAFHPQTRIIPQTHKYLGFI